jgi:hypothetical protein
MRKEKKLISVLFFSFFFFFLDDRIGDNLKYHMHSLPGVFLLFMKSNLAQTMVLSSMVKMSYLFSTLLEKRDKTH